MEKERLDNLPRRLKLKKMERDFDVKKERECSSCFYDLHLSATGCRCSPDQFSCLKHANNFCSCEIDSRFVLLRYTMNELNTLVDALEGVVDSVKAWASDTSTLASANEVVCVAKVDNDGDTYGTNSHDQRESSSLFLETGENLNINVPCTSSGHVSSEVIQPESQHGSFSYSTPHFSIDSHNAIINDEAVAMNSESNVGHGFSIDLNLDVMLDVYQSGLLHTSDSFNSKAITNVEEVSVSNCKQENAHSSDTARGPDLMQHDSDRNLLVSHVLLNGDYPSSSRHVGHPSSIIGNKLFGVDLLSLHPHSKLPSNSSLKIGIMGCHPMQKLYPCIEPINLGTLMFGRLWCSKQAIFPKGMLEIFAGSCKKPFIDPFYLLN